MSNIDLCSAVFVLRTSHTFAADQFLGRAVYKLLLLMLNRLAALSGESHFAELAKTLHDQDAALPFTASDLFQSAPEHYWIRLTGLEPTLGDALQRMVETLAGEEVEVLPREGTDDKPWTAKIEMGLMAYHDWAGQMAYDVFVDGAWAQPAQQRITLDFMTPTALRSVGVVRPFPDPALVFKLLYERLLKLEGIRLPFRPDVASLEVYADHFVEITDYQILCAKTPVKQKLVTAFYGWATYALLPDNGSFRKRAQIRQQRDHDASLLAIYQDVMSHHNEYACLLNLLAAFAFYSGVGWQTGQGMGMVRRVERHGH